jgi:hypothetical protein
MTCCCVCCGCKKNGDIAPSDKDTFFKVYADISARFGFYVDNIFSDAAGNFYMLYAETMNGSPGEKIYKADSKGNIIQSNTFFYYPSYYTPASNLSNYRVAFDGSCFYFVGYDTSLYYYFLKITTEGKVIFKINTDNFIPAGSNAVVQQAFVYLANEKNILVGGSIYDYDLGYSYPFVRCYSSDGNLLWQSYLNDIPGKAFTAATERADNAYLLVANNGSDGDGPSLLVRLSSNGTFSWKKELSEDIISLSQVSDNHYMCLSGGGLGPSGESIPTKVSVMDSSGNFKRSVILSTPESYFPACVAKRGDKMTVVLNNASFLILSPIQLVQESFVYEIDANGSISNKHQFGKMGTDMTAYAMTVTQDDHIVFCGAIRNSSDYKLFTMKTD